MSKPRIWIAAYLRDWSFDITARAIAQHLGNRYDIRIAYADEIAQLNVERAGPIAEWEADCYIDLWWHGTLHYTLGRKVLKQISSHRWSQMKWGSLKPSNVLATYADDVGAIAVPSRRLLELFRAVDPGLRDAPPRQFMLAQKGFDPDRFYDLGERGSGEMTVGWAGSIVSRDKHVDQLIESFPSIFIAGGTSPDEQAHMLELGTGRSYTYATMPAFYNQCDVIAIASEAEGDPRPLIEGMACGCFPVATDVGIVPELVRHLDNGYIIPVEERGPEAFRKAFDWCRANLAYVRSAGRINAQWCTNFRTWEAVIPTWDDAITAAIARGADGVGPVRYGD